MRAIRRHKTRVKKAREKYYLKHGIYLIGRMCSCSICKPWKYGFNTGDKRSKQWKQSMI